MTTGRLTLVANVFCRKTIKFNLFWTPDFTTSYFLFVLVRLETSHKEEASEEEIARNKSNKLLCIVLTCSKLIESRGRAVRDTWSKRCDKTIFVSDAFNPSFDVLVPEGSVAGYDNLWATTRAAFQYVHLKFLDDFDWFLKSDDDTYVIVENLKHYLSNFESDEALFFGKHFTTQGHYMAGGPGYVLSREAVKRLIVALNSDNDSLCSTNTDQGGEDVQMGWSQSDFFSNLISRVRQG